MRKRREAYIPALKYDWLTSLYDPLLRILSGLFFHHLTRENKRRTLREAFRVLRPGGELHVADWGRAQNGLMRVLFFSIQLLDRFEATADNVAGRLPELIRAEGFADVQETVHYATPFGTLILYRAKKLEIPARD